MERENFYAAPQAQLDSNPVGSVGYTDEMLATRLQRFGAAMIDWVLVMVIYIPLGGAYFLMEAGNMGEEMLFLGIGVMGLGGLGMGAANIWFLYDNGQTIGKKVLGIKIVRDDLHTRASLKRIIFFRTGPVWVMSYLSCIGAVGILVNYLAIFGEERRCIHDFIAGTHVVVDHGVADTESYGYLESGPAYQKPTAVGGPEDWQESSDDGGYTTNQGF